MKTFVSPLGRIATTLLLFITVAFASRAADTLDIWRWRNPLPSGNGRGRVDYLNGQFVVLSGTAVTTSSDGTNWMVRYIPIDGYLDQITYGNGRYVAVGSGPNGGLTASSSDLVTWTTSTPGTPYPLNAVAFGEGMFIAVGAIGSVSSNNYTGYVISSTNGLDWTLRSAPTNSNTPITDVVYGAGKFVAALGTSAGRVLVSEEGTNWTFVVVTNGRSFTKLSFTGGKFFASGYHYVSAFSFPDLANSTDGLTWSSSSDPRPTATPYGAGDFRVVAGNGIFLGIIDSGSNTLSSSADGNTFTAFSANGYLYTDYFFSRWVTFGNGLFVNNSLQTSPDGTNWSQTAVSPTNGVNFFVTDMLQNTNGYVAIATPLLVSSNGLKFSVATNTLPAYPLGIKFANGLYHGAGIDGAIIRSTNGLNWELRNSATTQTLSDIDFGNATWVAVGNTGTITASSTGNAWSLRTSGTALPLSGIVYANNLFVAVGNNGTLLTSPDGISWSPQYVGTLQNLYRIAFGNGQFIAVGQNGTIIVSSDATNWTASVSGTGTTLGSIAFGNGVYCTTGAGVVLTSGDGLTWKKRLPGGGGGGVRFFNGTFFTFGGRDILQSGPVLPVQLQAAWSNDLPQISIHASANLLMRLESADDLAIPSWIDRGLISTPTNGNFIFQDSSNNVQISRFYRVVAP